MNTMSPEAIKENIFPQPDSPVSSAPEIGQLLFIRSVASRRDTRTTSADLDVGSSQPLVSSSTAEPHSYTMPSNEFMRSTPLFVQRSKKSLFYKILCFLLLVLQGGVLDFYLIVFTDLYWCSWIATDLVVISGWGIFFMKNSRSKRERACGFHQKSSMFSLGDFTFAYLAWLIYVIACTPKVVLVLETSILDLIALNVPFGITGFKVTMLLCAPLLYCLMNSITEDPSGATRLHSHNCFMSTCVDILDSFTLVELLLHDEIPSVYLQYAVISGYFIALAVPVVWLYELTASEMNCGWVWTRFFTGVLVNAPPLAVRCVLVFGHEAPVSVFMLKDGLFLGCKCLELVERCASLRRARRFTRGRGASAPQFPHRASSSRLCEHAGREHSVVDTFTRKCTY